MFNRLILIRNTEIAYIRVYVFHWCGRMLEVKENSLSVTKLVFSRFSYIEV